MMAIHGRATPRQDRKIAAIVKALEEKHMTGEQLAAKLFASYQNVMLYVRMMRADGRVHVAGWVRSGGRANAVYGLGCAPDAPFVRKDKMKNPRFDRQKAKVLAMLAEPLNMRFIAARLGVNDRQAAIYVRVLREEKLVYISHWSRTNGNPAPNYRAGQGVDAVKPARRTRRYYTEVASTQKKGWAAALQA